MVSGYTELKLKFNRGSIWGTLYLVKIAVKHDV